MISWIQKYFQHHFRTVFAVLLAVTIISFVFVIGATPGIGNAERRSVPRPFFDLNLNASADSQRLLGDANLSAFLNLGYTGIGNAQLERYALQRYAALVYADRLHIPGPASGAELTDFLKTLRAFSGQNGEFDPQLYARFRDSLKTNSGIRESDVTRIIADDFRVDRVQKLLAGPGYVLPGDVKQQLARADTSWTLAVATVDYDSFKPAIAPTDAELTSYFDFNSARYVIPPRFSGSYVEFAAADYLSQVTVTDAEVRALYDANPARFPNPAKAQIKDAKPEPEVDFAAVKAQVATTLRLDRARKLAQKAASEFSVQLFDSKATLESANALLAARKLAFKPLAPFARTEGPAELGGSPEIGAEAFKLGKDRLFSDALPTLRGAAILVWQETIPDRKPLFAEVRAKVLADFTKDEKGKRFAALGQTLRATLEARLKAGDTFEKAAEAAATAASVKIETKTLKPFTLRQPPQDLDYPVYGTLERLEKGRVSDMAIAGAKGYLVLAVDKKTPEFTEANPQYAAAKNQLAQVTGSATMAAVLNELVEQELKKGEPVAR
jgi:peptidyl-prolyl cis-trans isomerase D